MIITFNYPYKGKVTRFSSATRFLKQRDTIKKIEKRLHAMVLRDFMHHLDLNWDYFNVSEICPHGMYSVDGGKYHVDISCRTCLDFVGLNHVNEMYCPCHKLDSYDAVKVTKELLAKVREL